MQNALSNAGDPGVVQSALSPRNSPWSVTARKSKGRSIVARPIGLPDASSGNIGIVSPCAYRLASRGEVPVALAAES